jgi:ligand-binding sensor domain-containing protein
VFLYDGASTINFTEKYQLRKEDTEGNSLHRIFSIAEDDNGNIWFGTIESGVWRSNPESEEFTNFTENDGLESNHIWTIIRNKKS